MLSIAKLMKKFGKVPINVSKLKSIGPVVGIHMFFFFFYSGAPSARPCVDPYLRKCGNLFIREILVIT